MDLAAGPRRSRLRQLVYGYSISLLDLKDYACCFANRLVRHHIALTKVGVEGLGPRFEVRGVLEGLAARSAAARGLSDD